MGKKAAAPAAEAKTGAEQTEAQGITGTPITEAINPAQEATGNADLVKLVNQLAAQNTILAEKLANLETNTAQENELLGERIAKIAPQSAKSTHNPYDAKLLYKVYNEEAKTTTIMGGDEVEGIVGIQEHITVKLKNGAKKFDKHPYKVELIEE